MTIPKISVWHRRLSQALFLGLWLVLFWQTSHQQWGAIPPDLFLMTDPLISTLATAASRIWISETLYALVLVGLTFVFGRFFCGWICPLGTLLDLVGRLWRGRVSAVLRHDAYWRRVKYYILIALCIAALAGAQLVYLGDPLVILFRAVATGLMPSTSGESTLFSFIILLVIIGLSGITQRFWCRYLCPLGAFYGAVARFSLFRRRRLKGCDGCKGMDQPSCQQVCAMGASPVNKQGSPEECIRSLNCRNNCHADAIAYTLSIPLPDRRENTVDLNRRTFVVTLGAGAIAGVASREARAGVDSRQDIVRPPMVTDQNAFMDQCVRCEQCVRSCPTGTLQPLLLEAGFYGIWTPAVTARIGGCRDDCNACSLVCPTGAIPQFGPLRQQKWSVKMGQAVFDQEQCISYARDAVKPCLKCVEVCPNRAIIVDWEAQPVRPTAVDYSRCIGCGLCVRPCGLMVIGKPALTLTANGVGTPAVLVRDPKPILPGDKESKHYH
ncbi:MAG: 4Fe-4S binding protein [Deltaproteobacteria bacterium]|nr:4Fe-4S binding protein [Deltaproteobacteria bacterium]